MNPVIQYFDIYSIVLTGGCLILTSLILFWYYSKSRATECMYPQENRDTVPTYSTPKNNNYSSGYSLYEEFSQYHNVMSTFSTSMMSNITLNTSDKSLDMIMTPGTYRRNLDTRVAKLLDRCDNIINTNTKAAKNAQNV